MFKQSYTVDDNDVLDDILLYSDSIEFLQQKAVTILAYAKNTYPLASYSAPDVKETEDPEFSEQGLKYQLSLKTILPPLLKAMMDLTYQDEKYCEIQPYNCVESSLIASGTSVATKQRSWHSQVDTIELKMIRPGDMVTISSNPSHAFVYLDEDMCISMNGIIQPLQFHSLEDVLKTYQLPFDLFKQTDQPENISIYRKKSHVNFSNDFITQLINFYYLCASKRSGFLLNDSGYPNFKKSFLSLQQLADNNYEKHSCETIMSNLSSRVKDDLQKTLKIDNRAVTPDDEKKSPRPGR